MGPGRWIRSVSALRVMEEWSAKTRLASGAGLARGGGARRFKALDQSVTSQVEGLLVDMPNLVRRTQLRRSGGRALGDIPGDNDASDEVNGKKNGLILNGKRPCTIQKCLMTRTFTNNCCER